MPLNQVWIMHVVQVQAAVKITTRLSITFSRVTFLMLFNVYIIFLVFFDKWLICQICGSNASWFYTITIALHHSINYWFFDKTTFYFWFLFKVGCWEWKSKGYFSKISYYIICRDGSCEIVNLVNNGKNRTVFRHETSTA